MWNKQGARFSCVPTLKENIPYLGFKMKTVYISSMEMADFPSVKHIMSTKLEPLRKLELF